MHLQALIHLADAAAALVRAEQVLVFGSSAILGSFPELGQPGGMVESTLDADLLVLPSSENILRILDDGLGEQRSFHATYGYYADLLRPKITELLPREWETRLVRLQGSQACWCLEPYDLAVAKLIAGREKDIQFLRCLVESKRLEVPLIRQRLDETRLAEKSIPRIYHCLTDLGSPSDA